jgi:hypothetical protein
VGSRTRRFGAVFGLATVNWGLETAGGLRHKVPSNNTFKYGVSKSLGRAYDARLTNG